MPVSVHESILGGILWCEEGGGMTERGAVIQATTDTNLKATWTRKLQQEEFKSTVSSQSKTSLNLVKLIFIISLGTFTLLQV